LGHGKGRGDKSPSLRIQDGYTRLLVRCFGGCDSRDVIDELRRRKLIAGQPAIKWNRAAGQPVARTQDDRARRQHEKASWLWSQHRPIVGSIAEAYLRSRGITCALPPTLAFLPAHKPEHHPAMIAAFAIPDEIEPGILGAPRNVVAVHLTLLKPDGTGKADAEPNKIIIGSPTIAPPHPEDDPIGVPIVIAPPNDLLGLAITEGIEDGLSVFESTGLGVWVAGAAGLMPKLAEAVPLSIDYISVFSDADRAGAGNGTLLADRLKRRGIFAEIVPLAEAQSS
jgi:hypothetical protein